MTVGIAAETLGLQILNIADPDREILKGYTGDLLSWVMGRAEEGSAWITIMSNNNIIAVSTLIDMACIILCDSTECPDDLIALAKYKKVNLLSSPLPAFELSHRLGELLNS